MLLAINVLSAIAADIFRPIALRFLKNQTAKKQARFIFALSVFPFAGALIFVLAFLLPAYLLYEPHKSGEVVSFKLAVLSFISLSGISVAVYRVFGTWWTTRGLVADWLKNAEPIEIENVFIPVYRLDHQFPVIAVVGMFRPRMFVAKQIFESLSPAELRAAIAHEHGHLAARDNFQRIILRISRDLLVFPLGKTLERAWTEAAESAADEYAAQTGGNLSAINLASALIKIARIVPEGAKPVMPAGAFLITDQTESISRRIRHLLELSETNHQSAKASWLASTISSRIFPVALIALLVFLGTDQKFLEQIHDVTEKIVAIFQ